MGRFYRIGPSLQRSALSIQPATFLKTDENLSGLNA
jgi:hypothetical protein